MKGIDLSSVPKHNFRASRRRYGEYACVVMNNQYFELDAISDAVWMSCDGSTQIAAIAERVGQTCKLAPELAATATCLALVQLRSHGLTDWAIVAPKAEA